MVANVLLDENVYRRHGPFGAGPLLGRAVSYTNQYFLHLRRGEEERRRGGEEERRRGGEERGERREERGGERGEKREERREKRYLNPNF
jgi:hypothetical protein